MEHADLHVVFIGRARGRRLAFVLIFGAVSVHQALLCCQQADEEKVSVPDGLSLLQKRYVTYRLRLLNSFDVVGSWIQGPKVLLLKL